MILEKIAAATKIRVESEKEQVSLEKVKRKALELPKGDFAFEKQLKKEGMTFICEVKKASPSKGVIAQDFPFVEIAKEYESANAGCISVLTEPDFFQGDKKYLKEISENVNIPLLRKDFVIDEYMIYDAKLHGASCVLLICSLLDENTIREYIKICDTLGLSALVEAHDEAEIQKALNAKARIIGVNNRDLKTFTVDISNSERLRKLVPEEILFVAESGIKTKDDVRRLKSAKVDAVLIGETYMRSPDKAAMLKELDS